MADTITLGEVLEPGDAAPRSEPATPKQTRDIPAPPITVAAIPVETPKAVAVQVTPTAKIPPPPSEADKWFADTPYAKSKSAAAAAAKGLISAFMGIPQTAYHAQASLLDKVIPGTEVARNAHRVSDMSDEAVRSVNNVFGDYHPEFSPGAEFAGALLNPATNKVGQATATIKLAGPVANLAARSAASGVAGAAMNPVTDIENYWGTKLKDLGWGAGISGGLGVLTKGAGALIAPQVQKAAKALEAKGVNLANLTLGQLLGGGAQKFEDWAERLPFSGIKQAKDRGEREIMEVAPWRAVGKAIGHEIDEKAPIQDTALAILGGEGGDGQRIKGAISQAYDDARATAPLIPTRAVPNAAGDDFKKNVGTPKVINDAVRTADSWAQQGGEEAEGVAKWVKGKLSSVMSAFNPDMAKDTHFADAKDLHNKIKYLGERISEAHDAADTNPALREYWKGAAGQLTKVRDHLYNLWANTDQKSFDALRRADKAYGSAQALTEAMKAAKLRAGVPTPEDLLRAGAKGESAKNVATRSVDYAPYAQDARTVLGPIAKPEGEFGKLVKAAPTLGLLGSGAVAGYFNPTIAGAIGAGGLGSLAASRALYGPTLNLGNILANPGPKRQAARQALENAPAYLTPAGVHLMDRQ